MLSFPAPVLSSLFVSFRPSLIRFPQLFLRCFPCALAFGIFRCPSGFFRPLLFRLQLLSLPCFPFPSSRSPLTAVLSVRSGFLRPLCSPLLSGLFPCLPSDFGTQLPAISFLRSLFRVTGTTQLPASCFQLGRLLCFRFRFRLLGLSFSVFVHLSDVTHNITAKQNCQHLFCI